ncbi:MAG: ABC transporter ATP-binding protein [Treponema sp.]|nr:ABC transporter ATP-binding protein [Treponema sp.]
MNYNDSPVKIFFSYYKPHLKIFFVDMFFALVYATVDLAFPVLSKITLEKFLPQKMYSFFFVLIAIMIALYLLRSTASYIVTYWGHRFGLLVETDMRRDAFAHVEKQSYSFFDKHRTGHLMSRVTYDLFDITELAHHGPEDILISIVTFIGSFIIMLTIRWELAVIVYTIIPLMLFFTAKSRKKMSSTQKKVKEKTAEINSSIESSISGIRVTKVFTNENYENEKFKKHNDEYMNAKVSTHKAFAGFHFRIEFFTHILYVVVLAVGGYMIMQEKMQISDIVAANLFVAAFLQPIRRMTNFAELLTTGSAGFMRFVELMRTNDETPEKDNAIELTRENAGMGDIVFSGVKFSYNDSVNVLSNVNLHVRAGKTIALVGPSGGGKTSLCNLIPRFYEISSGSIKIGDTDIRDFTLKSLRKNIGIVQQDVFLFATSVKENIAYGKADATDEEIIEAAKRAKIHDEIMKMSDGYDTIVGERGIRLSGGQKQRISIARIFLKNPPILILDEATSALDTETELQIQSSFDELIKGRTTFVIAHRLSTISNADKIAVVSDEGISEIGTHAELIASGGIYSKLYEAQHG